MTVNVSITSAKKSANSRGTFTMPWGPVAEILQAELA
jgi:hypothetical protein